MRTRAGGDKVAILVAQHGQPSSKTFLALPISPGGKPDRVWSPRRSTVKDHEPSNIPATAMCLRSPHVPLAGGCECLLDVEEVKDRAVHNQTTDRRCLRVRHASEVRRWDLQIVGSRGMHSTERCTSRSGAQGRPKTRDERRVQRVRVALRDMIHIIKS